MNAGVDEWLMVPIPLDNVGEKYTQFVHRIVASQDEIPGFDKIVTTLYEEDRLLKRDTSNIAMAAATKRYKKGMEDKKSSRKSNANSGRGGRGGNNSNNSGGGDRHSKNLNNMNYKGDGDPPECNKCTPHADGKLKKHWLYHCWTLHKDRMPEKYQNNRPKPDKATARKDDFVDSTGTRFSAMAMFATFEQGIEGDDEYWGWSVNDTALQLSSEMTEEPNIQSLEQSLTELAWFVENREITKNGIDIQADHLVSD